MITFIPLETTNNVLRIINNCIMQMIKNELFYYSLIEDDENEKMDYLINFFPNHLCREEPQKCINTLHDLLEWTKDSYLHDLTSIHEYSLFKIFESFFDEKEDFENVRKKGQKNPYKFHVKNIENYEPYEIDILKRINDRFFYEEELFWDLDFLYLDDIVYLYQTNRKKFYSIGVNLRYYLDIMPKDIRKEIELCLDNEKKEIETENFIINQISNAIKQLEMNPVRLEKYSENEISDDIKDRIQFALEMKNINIEREARGGFANKETGEIDFFLYKNENHRYLQLAIGENKVWGNFKNQLRQLLGYSNKNMQFGFTIVINKNTIYQKVKNAQKEILNTFNLEGDFKVLDIKEENGILISTHTIPEENKPFKIYHFILNANVPERRKIAKVARNIKFSMSKSKSTAVASKDTNTKEVISYILNTLEKKVTFNDMLDILNKMRLILLDNILEEGLGEVIAKFKEIGNSKRKNASLVIDNKKYNNIQIFNDKDSPIMGFVQKIRNKRTTSSMYTRIEATINQYNKFDCDKEHVIKKKYIKKALEIAQKKFKALDLLKDKKINIFITGKGREDLKSDSYIDFENESYEIFIYSDVEAIYTILYQLGSIINDIICDEGETIPKSFIKVNKKINVNILEATKEERKIIFSDIFAITSLNGTDLEPFAPFLLESNKNKILEEYFEEEISKKIVK